MHPLIRLLCLLSFALLAPWLPPVGLVIVGVLLLGLGLGRPDAGRAMLSGVRRIRWLLLSIVVLYLWFTPGEPVLPWLGALSPTTTGLALAVERSGVLVVMLWAALATVTLTPREQLVAALRRLACWPVHTRTGERFADRVGLLLAELPAVEQNVRDAVMRARDQALAERAAAVFTAVEAAAIARPFEPEPAFALPPVPGWQKPLPLLLLLSGGACVYLN